MINKALFFILIFIVLSCDTASTIDPLFEEYFIKYYGDRGSQFGVDMVVNPDGTMVLLGTYVTPPPSKSAPFALKVDRKGQIIWQRYLGNEEGIQEEAVDIEVVQRGPHSGDLIIVSNITSANQIRLFRLDQSGAGKDSVIISVTPSQRAMSVTPLEIMDGYVIAGSGDPSLTPDPLLTIEDKQDILGLYIDNDFDQVQKFLTQGGESEGSGVRAFDATYNGETKFFMFSYADRLTTDPNDVDLNFEAIVNGLVGNQDAIIRVEENLESQIGSSVIMLPPSRGGGYLMVGTGVRGNARNIFISIFDKELRFTDINKNVTVSNNVEGVAASVDENDGYYVLGNQSTDGENNDIFLMKTDFLGTPQWSRVFGTASRNDLAGGIQTLPDGRVAIIGSIALESQESKMVLIVVNERGEIEE